jgi:PAS domain S-box-containing protein
MFHWLKELWADSHLQRQILRRGFLWTMTMAVFIGLGAYFSGRESVAVALTRARDIFQDEAAVRLLATQLEGAPAATAGSKPLAMGDSTQSSKFFHDLNDTLPGLRGHLTSLRPLRSENAADPWEQKALQQFESGAREYWEKTTQEGPPRLRFMGALATVEGCLRCHVAQGYRVGDVRGGISVTVPLNQGSSLADGFHDLSTIAGLSIIWVMGIGVILMAGKWNLSRTHERRRAAAALAESDEQLRVIFEASEAGIFMVAPSGTISFANGRMAEMFGMSLQELVRTTYSDHLHETEQRSGDARMRQLISGGIRSANLERHYVRQDGTDFWGHLSVRRLEGAEGRLRAVVGIISDITEHKRAAEALRESEAQNRALLDAIPDLIFVNSRDGEFLDYHAADPSLLVIPPEVFLHRRIADVLPERYAGQFMNACMDALDSGAVQEIHYSITHAGAVRHFEARVAPCNDAKVVTIVRDVTNRKNEEAQKRHLELQLQQVQKMDSLGSLAGGVAHDMNNVLGAILGMASANLGTLPAESREHQAFATIIQAAERGGKMVKGLLGFARRSPAEDQKLDLNAILREEISLLERTTLAKIRLEVDFAEPLWPIRGDAGALSHAFMNLCINAVDAMPDNGTLTLRTQNIDSDWVEVRVEDTGCGMPKEVLERSFEPYFTTKDVNKGTGLGLAMVYSTVKAHQGQIEIQSQPGEGTRVRMRFPASDLEKQPLPPEDGPRLSPPTDALFVLLVDDDELIQSTMQTMLKMMGHRVASADCGEEALAQLGSGLAPDVVILDMNMPGLGGSGTLPRLRALQPEVPVLLATGRADQTAVDLTEAFPNVTLLPKPFGINELQRYLQRLRRP